MTPSNPVEATSGLYIEANVSGNNSGQIAIGHGIYQITQHGGSIKVIQPNQAPSPKKLPIPIRLRPRRFEDLIGRETELQQCVTALEAAQTIELYGAAGVGKSVLLRHLAHHSITDSKRLFPDGVVYFHVHQHELVEDLQQRLYFAFYRCDRFRPSSVRIQQDLQDKRALILLDNTKLSRKDIEQLWKVVPNCVFLFASQEQNLWGEGRPIPVRGLAVDKALLLMERDLNRTLNAQEHKVAESICSLLDGHPLEVLQQIAQVREGTETLDKVIRRIQSVSSPRERIQQLIGLLNVQQRSALAALAALGGIALSAKQVSAIADIQNADSVLGKLQGLKFVQESLAKGENSQSVRYSLSSNLLDPLQQQENLNPYLERAISYFTPWAQQATPDSLQQESEAVSYLLDWAVKNNRWNDVLLLGRPFESALAVSGQWELQAQVLQWYQQAAEQLGNKTAIAHALHQRGIRSLCLGQTNKARNQLTEALQLREELGDKLGADLTRQHLNLKFPIPFSVPETIPTAPPQPIPPSPEPQSWIDPLKKLLVPAVVTGLAGVSVTSVLLTLNPRSPQPDPPTSTSPLTVSSPISPVPDSPDIEETPSPEPSPTPVADSSIPECVAADVRDILNIRPEPSADTEPIGGLTPRQEASTTGMRQGNFIGIDDPVQGWVSSEHTKPCGTPPEDFERAPKPTPSPTPSLSPQPLPPESPESPEPPEEPSSACSQPPTSEVVNGLRLTIEDLETVDGLLRIHVKVDNESSGDQDLTAFFSQLYIQDDLGKLYGFNPHLWGIRIPGSGFTRSDFTLAEPIQQGASTISVNFGNVEGKKLCISGISVR